MKKITLTLAAIAVATLSGCQLTGGSESKTDITSLDFESMSCEQIQTTFSDYRSQMDNLDTGASLLSTVGIGAGASAAKATMSTAYATAMKAAKPVAKAKKCSVNF